MKFEEILSELHRNKSEPISKIKASEKNTTTKDPDSYPDTLWPWDTGIADRGPTGAASDVNVLTHKEKLGRKNGKQSSKKSD